MGNWGYLSQREGTIGREGCKMFVCSISRRLTVIARLSGRIPWSGRGICLSGPGNAFFDPYLSASA